MLFDETRIDIYQAQQRGNGTGRRTWVNVPRIQVITPATADPVTLAELQAFLKVDSNSEDAELTALISAATANCETMTGRAFMSRTIKAWYDAAPPDIFLPLLYSPVSAITYVQYYGDDDVAQTLAATAYQVDLAGEPARLIIKNGSSWPTSLRPANALEVKYVVGYASAAVVPNGIKQAIKLMCAHYYEGKDSQKLADNFKTILDAPMVVQLALQPFALAQGYGD